MSGPIVHCETLSKAFNGTRAVQDVSVAIEEGSLFALVGPSGCGKTTTLRLIAGFERADSGAVAIRGRIVSGPGVHVPAEQRRVGMVFQDYALFPHLSVRENVGFGVPKGGESKSRVHAVLELVGLAEVGARLPHDLSGGEQQRVALARALAPNPAVVLLDEPFSNLDASLRARVRAEVRQILKRAGTSAIFVTHDQDEALSLADQVGVMLEGRVVQTGTPEDVYTSPASLAVATFLGEANLLDGHAADGKVQTELGLLPTTTPANGPVTVVVRPELVQLHQETPGMPDAPGGTLVHVVDREFYGHDQLIHVRLPSGASLRVRRGPGHAPDSGEGIVASVSTAVPVFPATD